MHIKIVSIATLAILIWSATPVAINESSALGNSLPAIQSNAQAEFNLLLARIMADSTIAQLAILQDFLHDHADLEPVYHVLLEWYLYNDRLQEAKTYFQKLTLDMPNSRNSYWMLAKIFMRENNAHEAFKAFTLALKNGEPSLPLLEEFIKFDYQQSGRFEGADIIRQLGLNAELQEIVSAFYHYYKFEYAQAIEVFKKTPKHIYYNNAVVLHVWGKCVYALSHYTEADSIWRIGLMLSNEKSDLRAKAKFLTSLGFLQQILLKHDFALSYYDSAYAIAKHINDHYQIQLLAGYRAFINLNRGKYLEAEKQFEEAVRIASRIAEPSLLVDWLRGYGATNYYLGSYNSALQIFEKCEVLAREINDLAGVMKTKIGKVDVYVSLKQHTLAKKTLEDIHTLAKIKNLIYYQKFSKARLGEILILEKEYATARAYYQEFIDFLDTNPSLRANAYWWLGRLARTYMLERRYEMAEKVYQQGLVAARDVGAKTFEGWYLLRIADIELILGNTDAALKNYELAREIAIEQNNTEMLWEILIGYGNAYKKTDNLQKAITFYERAAHIVEQTRDDLKADQLRIGYFIEGYQAYQNLIDCFLQHYEKSGGPTDLDSLYYYVAMGRARALKDLKRPNRLGSSNEEYQQTCKQLRVLQRRLREESNKLASVNKLDSLLSQIEAVRFSLLSQRLRVDENDQDRGLADMSEIPSLSKVFDNLKKNDFGLLLYQISEENPFVIAIGREIKVVRLQASQALLTSSVDSLMMPFHHVDEDSMPSMAFRAAIAHRLYGLLVKPVEEVMALPKRLIVVPDFVLVNLPFEMLLAEKPEMPVYRPFDFPTYADHFLSQKYTVVYMPSAGLLQEKSKLFFNNQKVLVFANPFTSAFKSGREAERQHLRTGWRFDPLPFSEVEARQIKAQEPRTQVYTREIATKTAFLQEAPQSRIVHLATHAFVDTVFDAFSGLVLATDRDSTDDGILMGYEIADLNLLCDLVTLSACETGRGRLVVGEGTLGLPRLFLGAGAKSVLMTLWKVDDRLASELMPIFYEKFLQEKLPKTDALAEAKRTILSRKTPKGDIYYQHPFYWASFVLYGDPGMRQVASLTRARMAVWLTAILILGLASVFSIRYWRRRHHTA